MKFSQSIIRGLQLLPPELSHDIAIYAMERGWTRWLPRYDIEPQVLSGMKMQVDGIGVLSHPIGLAAGFDKDLRCAPALAELGFSFIEAGTVTPKPQPGNPKPRLFRLKQSMALINRMGFNSRGYDFVNKKLQNLSWKRDLVPLGINVGKNRDTALENAHEDYAAGIEIFAPKVPYVVVNISSPNTSGLRDLASRDFIKILASRCSPFLDKIWIKLDPDKGRAEFQDLVSAIFEHKFKGLILTNTHRVQSPFAGGLSGAPLGSLSLATLEWAWDVHRGALPMISCGGIISGSDVFARILRGASAVQIYTSFVYRGPWAVNQLLEELHYEMKLREVATLKDIWGQYYR